MPPVYGTAAPLHALSGVIRKTAYRYPDHWLRHWLMLLFADRVDLFEARTRRLLPLAIVAVPLAVSARHVLAKRRLGPTRRIRARWGAASR